MVAAALRRIFSRDPYGSVIEEIKEMSTIGSAGRIVRISDAAKWQAIGFIHSFSNLGREVPVPFVTATPNAGVAVRWLTPAREVEIIFLEKGGEFSVAERGKEDVLQSGFLGSVDLLKDVVKTHVLNEP